MKGWACDADTRLVASEGTGAEVHRMGFCPASVGAGSGALKQPPLQDPSARGGNGRLKFMPVSQGGGGP